MPRSLRIEYSGAHYHVLNRAKGRKNIFAEKGATEAFERTLDEAATRFGWEVHAYVIMRNHFHLALKISEPNLSVGMKWLQGSWALWYTRTEGIGGKPFQGRYKALLVEPGDGFAQLCHFIHLNPVRAKVTSAAKLDRYQASSFARFPEKGRPQWLKATTVLAGVSAGKDNASGWKRYQAYLGSLGDDKTAGAALNSKRFSRGWCIGSAKFKKGLLEGLRKKAPRRGGFRSKIVGSPTQLAEKKLGWEKSLAALARAAKINLKALPEKKSAQEKTLLAAALKQSTSASNAWIAETLDMGIPASASQFVRRVMVDKKASASVAALLKKVKT